MKTLIGSVALMLAAVGVCCAAAPDKGAASSYPTRPIRLIVPQAAGGSNDIMARYVGQYLTERLGRQVVVDNRPGADAIIGTELAARSAPDGHTLLMVSAAYTMNPAVRKVPYDPLKAFDWVAMLGTGPTVLTVGPSLPVSSVQELLAVGRAKPWPADDGERGRLPAFRIGALPQPVGARSHCLALQRRISRDDRRDGRTSAHDGRVYRPVDSPHSFGTIEADRHRRR
jgi:hypothetical protein